MVESMWRLPIAIKWGCLLLEPIAIEGRKWTGTRIRPLGLSASPEKKFGLSVTSPRCVSSFAMP